MNLNEQNLVSVINNETTPSYTYLQCKVILYEGMKNSEKLLVHVKQVVLKMQMLLGLRLQQEGKHGN